MTTTSDDSVRRAYMLACAALRKASPASPVPDARRSVRERGAWLLMTADGEAIATVADTGELELHAGHILVEEAQGDLVAARVITVVDTRWTCPQCATHWAKLGRHVGVVKTCRGCGATLLLYAADAVPAPVVPTPAGARVVVEVS